jgi:hypothetical protein
VPLIVAPSRLNDRSRCSPLNSRAMKGTSTSSPLCSFVVANSSLMPQCQPMPSTDSGGPSFSNNHGALERSHSSFGLGPSPGLYSEFLKSGGAGRCL